MEQLLPIWPILPYDSSHCRSTVRILVNFWSNNHSCPNQTRNATQAAGDPKVPSHLTSPRDLDIALGFKSELFIMLVLARKPFSQWSDLHASTSICPWIARLSPKKFLDDKLFFHLKILWNIILKVLPYLEDGSIDHAQGYRFFK
jgi:hypothetical protein